MQNVSENFFAFFTIFGFSGIDLGELAKGILFKRVPFFLLFLRLKLTEIGSPAD
jgi:hypothetical protein